MHALTDALLGAIGDGDIGEHFPPSDPKWKGASSDRFLADAVRRVVERGGRIVNLDVTMVCERPKISPHRDAMRARVAEIAGIDSDRVAVKATTSEKMGFTGRGEGIVAFAVATVMLPVKRVRTDFDSLVREAAELLDACRSRGLKIATAESCTGGLIAAILTEVPGSSDVFERGFVTYSNEAKTEQLGVLAELIEKHGAVSGEVAQAMANGALGHSRADIAIAVTGVAGPGGGTKAKPVGLVHLAAARRGSVTHKEIRLGNISRSEIRFATVKEAFAMVSGALR